MIWLVHLYRLFYWLLVFMVGSLWFGIYYLLQGVAITPPVLITNDPTRGVYESSLSTYEATLGAHLFLSLIVFIIAMVCGLLALVLWWHGFHKRSESALKPLIVGMAVILCPLPVMLPSALKVLPYTGEIYEGVQMHKGPVTIRFNPDGTHTIIPLD